MPKTMQVGSMDSCFSCHILALPSVYHCKTWIHQTKLHFPVWGFGEPGTYDWLIIA